MKTLRQKLLLAVLLTISTISASLAEGYEVGDIANDFSLKNIDGKMVSLKDYNDAKGYIVVFTCNHCPYAKLYEQRIIDLHNKYASQGYPVIAINPNDPEKQPLDSYENMKKRAKEKEYPFAYLFDETQDIAKSFGASRTPHVYILKKTQGKYQVSYIGAIDNNPQNAEEADDLYVENALTAIKSNKKVPLSSTKAIGCTIKWR